MSPARLPWIGDVDYSVIFLGRCGLIKHASDNACRWLREYFGTRPEGPGRLPKPLRRWLGGDQRPVASDRGRAPARAFSVDREGTRLVVRLIPDREWLLLLLEKQTPALDVAALKSFRLTRRESEVLAWVAMGKPNQDVATILGISPRTVKKHLEHVYAKLGVETRTAAAAVFVSVSSARAVGQPGVVGRSATSVERRIDKRADAPYVCHADRVHSPVEGRHGGAHESAREASCESPGPGSELGPHA